MKQKEFEENTLVKLQDELKLLKKSVKFNESLHINDFLVKLLKGRIKELKQKIREKLNKQEV